MLKLAQTALCAVLVVITGLVVFLLSLPNPPCVELTPIMVNRSIIDPRTGKTLQWIREAKEFGFAAPLLGKDGWFKVREEDTGIWLEVNAKTGSVVRSPEPSVRFKDGRMALVSPTGKKLWEIDSPTQWVGDVLMTSDKMIVAHDTSVSAYSVDSGNLLWTSPGNNDVLCIWGDLIVAIERQQQRDSKRTVLARRVSDGSEAWQADLPPLARYYSSLLLAGPWVVIRSTPGISSEGQECLSVLIDANGREHSRFKEYAHDILPYKEDWMLISNLRVARMDHRCEVLWQEKHRYDLTEEYSLMGTIVGSTLYIHDCFRLADTGVDVRRIDIDRGKIVWDAHCPRLWVWHSKYHQEAYLLVRGEFVFVVSQGSDGWFLEVLQAKDGRRWRRWADPMNDQLVEPTQP